MEQDFSSKKSDFVLGTCDAEDAPDGPDSRAEKEAGETSSTRGQGRCPGGHHHR